MEAGGIEHNSISQANYHLKALSGAFSGAAQKSAAFSIFSDQLERIIEAWPSLPPHIRETILTLLDSARIPVISLTDQLSKATTQYADGNTEETFAASTPFSDDLRRVLLKALRHTPESFSLKIDADGWVDLSELLDAATAFIPIPQTASLDDFSRLLDKLNHRGQFQIQSGRIRAAYGHSFPGFDPSSEEIPDLPLFHGTDARYWPSIDAYGLSPQKRSFVQLTTDFDYAEKLARSRNRKPILLQVMTAEAVHRRVRFFRTGTHVWLSTCIPSDCLQIWNTEPLEIDDWGIVTQGADELELDLLSFTSEQGDINNAKNH